MNEYNVCRYCKYSGVQGKQNICKLDYRVLMGDSIDTYVCSEFDRYRIVNRVK